MPTIKSNPYNFSTDQYQSYTKVIDFFNSPLGGMFLLTGAAGSGKTYLTAKLITQIKNNNVLLTCPTHKAIRVLRNETNITHRTVFYSTTHSALGLKEKIDGHGVVSFVADKKEPNRITKNNIQFLIVDEASMLNDDLFKELLPYVKKGLKILFVGDPVQIPPVGSDNASPFKESKQKEYNIKVSHLTTIIRQSVGHPIIETSFVLRNNISSLKLPFDMINQSTSMGKIEYISKSDLIGLFKKYFDTTDFRETGDFVRVLAWTNKKVNHYNDMIRTILFKHDKPQKIMIGEKLVMDAPVERLGKIILNNNDEIEVVSYEIKEDVVEGFPRKLKYYDALVKYDSDFFGGVTHKIKILHEDSDGDFKEIQEMIKTAALSYKQGTDEARMYWLMYYEVQKNYAKCGYLMAQTCHKSQGSTYHNNFIDLDDMMKNTNIVERNRILYTAMTRSKKNLYIITEHKS